MSNYMDKNLPPKERAKLPLAELSLDEKMAQVNCVFPRGGDFDSLLETAQENAPYGAGHVSCLKMRGLLAGRGRFPLRVCPGTSWAPALEREIGKIVSRQERCACLRVI